MFHQFWKTKKRNELEQKYSEKAEVEQEFLDKIFSAI
jgi:hypothetical protein